MEKFENGESWDQKVVKPKPKPSGVTENHHIKLWIGTIKNLSKHPSHENAGLFRNKSVTHVDILATVVDQFSYDKANIYVCMETLLFLWFGLSHYLNYFSG